MPHAKKLGEILVEHKILSPKTRDRILHRSQILERRFGSVLEELDLVSGEELATALAIQFGYPTTSNLTRFHIDPKLLEMIPVEVAMEHLIFPLRQDGGQLALAVADPTDRRAIDNFAANHHLKIIPFIATKQEIRAAISHHYLGKSVTHPTMRTVLVVDDDWLIQDMLSEILKKEDYKVLTARDGMEAFKTVITESPHVVVTDLVMPKLDGYGLINALKGITETSFIPVILITGQMKTEEEEVKAFESGFFDVIKKPFNQASVRARVKRAFHFYDHRYRLF